MSHHKKSDSSLPLVEGASPPSVVTGAALRAVSPERRRTVSRQRSQRSQQSEVPCRCDRLPPPPPQRAPLSVKAELALGGGAILDSGQHEQLLPALGGAGARAMRVDGHKASVTLTKMGLSWSYELNRCCVPSVRSESVLFSEMLAAEVAPPVSGVWQLAGTKLHRLIVWTFRRSPQNAACWFPRQLVLETPAEGVLAEWLQRIQAAIAQLTRRPRRLLVFINPFGGSRRARAIWATTVRSVFDKAGVRYRVVETEHGGHARALLTAMPATELAAYDGLVAIGGDGLFNELVNAVLELRSVPTGTSLDQGQWQTLQEHLDVAGAAASAAAEGERQAGTAQGPEPGVQGPQLASQPGLPTSARHARGGVAHRRTSSIVAALRIGHIPAGSTDAAACTLNGTRSAFTAAMHVALGDACPLDVLRVDMAGGEHVFATCMVSTGFMGDVMAESESATWRRLFGPLRYDVVGAKMLAANRSYRFRLSYLPAGPDQMAAAGKVCVAGCDLCRLGREHAKLQRAFRQASTRSLERRRSEWVHLEDDFAGIMLVVMPCRSEKSKQGVARYGHISDGVIHLVMVKKCSRLQYLRFLLTLSSTGLAAGEHGFFTVVPAQAVHVEPVGARQSRWNLDGELLRHNHITAEVHRGVIECFARGVETQPQGVP